MKPENQKLIELTVNGLLDDSIPLVRRVMEKQMTAMIEQVGDEITRMRDREKALEDALIGMLHLDKYEDRKAAIDNMLVPYRNCRACNAPRHGPKCWKCNGDTTEPAEGWEWPHLPPIGRIRDLAHEVGYAIGEHGSRERDLDLIAAPWRDGAVSAEELVKHLAENLPARILDPGPKPLGRYAVNLSMGGWTKMIDLSVCPAVVEAPCPA